MEGAISSLPNSRVAVVTGGNKGIGLEVCRQLARAGITVALTARDEERGAAAVEKLRDQGLGNVVFHQLEVTDARSVARLAGFTKTRFGRIDILVNNAGVSGLEYAQDHIGVSEEQLRGMDLSQRIELVLRCSRETCESGKQCLRTNYYGTKQVITALLSSDRCFAYSCLYYVRTSLCEFIQFRRVHRSPVVGYSVHRYHIVVHHRAEPSVTSRRFAAIGPS